MKKSFHNNGYIFYNNVESWKLGRWNYDDIIDTFIVIMEYFIIMTKYFIIMDTYFIIMNLFFNLIWVNWVSIRITIYNTWENNGSNLICI